MIPNKIIQLNDYEITALNKLIQKNISHYIAPSKEHFSAESKRYCSLSVRHPSNFSYTSINKLLL